MSIPQLGLVHDLPDDFSRQGERTPPHDLLAEQSTLGGMLLSKDAVAENADDVPELLSYCDEAAESSVNILRAYLKQRDSDEAGE